MESDEPMTAPVAPSRRPFSVTLLAIGVLIFAGINLIRLVASLQQREFLAGLLPVSPLYFSISGLIWLVVASILAAGLWLGRRWAVRATLVGILAYSLYYWLDRLLLAAEKPGYNWLFSVVINLSLLGIVYWVLNNRKAKIFFGELDDR
jgi:K+-sensing histidine kinase KdpD